MDLRSFIIIFIFPATTPGWPVSLSIGHDRAETESRIRRREEERDAGVSALPITLGSILGVLLLLLVVRKLYDRTKRSKRRRDERLTGDANSILSKMTSGGSRRKQFGDGAASPRSASILERMDRMLQPGALRSENSLADELEDIAANTDAGKQSRSQSREEISEPERHQMEPSNQPVPSNGLKNAEDSAISKAGNFLRKLLPWRKAAEPPEDISIPNVGGHSREAEAERSSQSEASHSRTINSERRKDARNERLKATQAYNWVTKDRDMMRLTCNQPQRCITSSTPKFVVEVFRDESRNMRLECSSHIVDAEHGSVHKLRHAFRMPGPGSTDEMPEVLFSQHRLYDFETLLREDHHILSQLNFPDTRTSPQNSVIHTVQSRPSFTGRTPSARESVGVSGSFSGSSNSATNRDSRSRSVSSSALADNASHMTI